MSRAHRLAPWGLALLLAAAASLALLALPQVPSSGPRREVPGGTPKPAEGERMAERSGRNPAAWKEIDRLVEEQKLAAALERVGAIREEARGRGDEEEWTRALIREVQLRTALHGFETAVRFLKDQPWPTSPLSRAVLDLFYGQALLHYLQAYSWEINQRERVVSEAVVDLKAWTRGQIFAEAQRAYALVWAEREAWGSEPVGTLAEYIEQNDYPPRIRGTLRDAVTYLWVELSADSSLWEPGESQDLFRLKLEELLADPRPAPTAGDLTAEEVHPLARIVTLLGDLEAWHAAEGRPEAAFEARLERLRRLAESFSDTEDRAAIRADLERGLDSLGRRYEWWAMGKAVLAELLRADAAPDALVEARRQAVEGADAHPDSVGGRRCRHLAAVIEAPFFNLTTMSSDGPGRRSIVVEHTNLETLHLRAYRFDLLAQVRGSRDYELLPGYREVPRLLSRQRPDAAWTVELPPTPDYRSHSTHVTPEITRPGLYVVVASARGDFREALNERQAVNLVVGDLVLLTRVRASTLEATAVSGRSGKPVAEAGLTLFRYDYQRGHQAVAERRTDAEGKATFKVSRGSNEGFFLLALHGEDGAIHREGLHFPPELEEAARTSALLFTDRSVYRPQQDLLWKVLAYRKEAGEGRFGTLPETTLEVELVDANGEVVEKAEVETNRFGTASGRFPIPAGPLLGTWQLRASPGGATAVTVEEYKRPTFEVTLADPETPLSLNRPATLSGSARYYFGLPVASGEASWQVTREPVLPHWGFWWGPPPGPPRVLAAGRAPLEADGTFRVAFTPEADERLATPPGVSFVYRLTADVTDEGGETRGASRAFRLGFVAVEAAIESDAGFFRAGEAAEVRIRRTDLNGVARPGKGSWRLLALEQPEAALLPADQPPDPVPVPPGSGEPYRTPGDRLRPRWSGLTDPAAILRLWPDGREARHGEAEHGADGLARLSLAGLAPGAYRLRYSTKDEFGAAFEAQQDWIVARDGATPLALPVALIAESPSVPVGGTARFLVHSGLADQELVVEVLRGDERISERRLASEAGARILELPVSAADRGGFGVRVAGVRDHQLLSGTAQVFVPWDDRQLEVAFASFRDKLRPGGRESWRVTVKGPDEAALAAGSAELLAYMYDKSLDLFAPHHPPDPLSVYPARPWAPPVAASLGGAWAMFRDGLGLAEVPPYPHLRGDRLKFLDAYGIGGPGLRALGFASGVEGGVMEGVPAPPAPAPMKVGDVQVMDMAAVAESPAARFEASEEMRTSTAPDLGEAGPPVELRSDFAETAFWHPHLMLGEDGAVGFEFTVPDSVTEWSVWVHAVTRDLSAGRIEKQARSVKDLLVRPYLPRFLREGDRAEIKVVVNNAGETDLAGRLDFDIVDPETEESLLAEFGLARERASGVAFSVAPGRGTDLTFPVRAPSRLGTVAFRVVARSGNLSDGELRPLPVLPGRLHLAQSRFATLHDRERKVLRFADMAAGDDPTLVHDQLVVTLDAQLFYSVLSALPYLVDYPYECTEQTLNRFLSTGILASLYDDYPAVARMAQDLAKRETRYETWDAADPNRKMELEETPWLAEARGGKDAGLDLVKVLDPRVAAAERTASLAKLRESQTSLGAFPWWPGGPPSPFMTLYILHGFSRALEFGVEVPQEIVVPAWAYLHGHYVDELARELVEDECCWELITLLNYVLSSYADESWTGGVFTADDREQMLAFSFRHWKQHSPLLKGYLALTLKRAGREADARLVWDSVMDSAKTTEEEGTFWAPEDRAWLWYNDTIETHAFALRTLSELAPADARRHGLVQWLFLNKKLNHWKSTRATAEVVYSLVHYLQQEGTLGAREEARVAIGPRRETFTFEPERYTGRRAQVVVPGPEVDSRTMAEIAVEKETPGFLFASATWHFSTEKLPAEARGDLFGVTRRYFKRVQRGREWVLEPLEEGAVLAPGDQVEAQLSISARHAAEYVHLRDPRGAGFEPETLTSGYKWDLGLGFYEEVRDSGTNFFFDWLPAGEYTLKVRLRANLGGAFRVGPATLQSMYAPEFTAYSSGAMLEVRGEAPAGGN